MTEDNRVEEETKNTFSDNHEQMEPSSSAISPDLAGNGVGKEEGKKDPDGENKNYAAESGSGTSKDITSDKEESKLKDCDAEENIAGKESTDGDNKSETKEEDEKKKPVDDQKPNDFSAGPVVSSTKKTRPPYKYDPNKVVLRFLFANRDGLTVTVECKPADTVGEVKAQLLSVWPDDLPECDDGDYLRLICMGKGMLMPDSRTLEDCQVPVFKTHPTPVNVAVRPKTTYVETSKTGKEKTASGSTPTGVSAVRATEQSGQGCGCVIQ